MVHCHSACACMPAHNLQFCTCFSCNSVYSLLFVSSKDSSNRSISSAYLSSANSTHPELLVTSKKVLTYSTESLVSFLKYWTHDITPLDCAWLCSVHRYIGLPLHATWYIHKAFQCLCTNNEAIWHLCTHNYNFIYYFWCQMNRHLIILHACTCLYQCITNVWLTLYRLWEMQLRSMAAASGSTWIWCEYPNFAQLVQVCTQLKSTSWLSANVHVQS